MPTRAGLLVSGQLRHPEIVAAIRATSSARVARLHSRVTELLYERGAEEADIARHLVKGDIAQVPWAQAVLRHAARQALLDNDPEFASSALELALRECRDEGDRLRLRCALTQLAWWVNPSVAARHFSPLESALTAGKLAPQDAMPVVRQLLWQGQLTGDIPARSGRYGRWAADMSARGLPSLFTLWSQGPGEELLNGAEHVLQGRLADTTPESAATAILVLDHAGRQQRAAHWCHTLETEAGRARRRPRRTRPAPGRPGRGG